MNELENEDVPLWKITSLLLLLSNKISAKSRTAHPFGIGFSRLEQQQLTASR